MVSENVRAKPVPSEVGPGVLGRHIPDCRVVVMRAAGVITHSVQLPAEPDRVFWNLLENAKEGGLDSSFEYWNPREWPPRVGTHNDFKTTLGVLSMRGVSRFAEFDPPRRLLIVSVKPARPLSVLMSWDLEPVSGGTLYTYRMEVEAVTGAGWLARSMVHRYNAQMARDVPNLAALF